MKLLFAMLAATTVLLLSSCFERSMVIKVERDGSGVVQYREFSSTSTTGEDVTLPGTAQLEKRAARMGEGVRLDSVEKASNRRGWFGHKVLYTFNDINTLRIDTSKDGQEVEDTNEDSGGNLEVTFAMKDGVLEAEVGNPEWNGENVSVSRANDGPTIDPYANSPGPKAAKLELKPSGLNLNDDAWKAMSKGMRLGIFLQIDDPLSETNASFGKGPLYTLVNVDMGRITEQGKLDDMQELEARSRSEMRELVDRVDGLEIDLHEPLRFVFE